MTVIEGAGDLVVDGKTYPLEKEQAVSFQVAFLSGRSKVN